MAPARGVRSEPCPTNEANPAGRVRCSVDGPLEPRKQARFFSLIEVVTGVEDDRALCRDERARGTRECPERAA